MSSNTNFYTFVLVYIRLLSSSDIYTIDKLCNKEIDLVEENCCYLTDFVVKPSPRALL